MTNMTDFEKVIKAHLDETAKKDKLFAKTYKKANKSIENCCKYIMGEAQKRKSGNFAAIPDDEVYGMAIHYYDEDDIVVGEAKAKVVTPTKVEPKKAKTTGKITLRRKVEPVEEEAEELSFSAPLFE